LAAAFLFVVGPLARGAEEPFFVNVARKAGLGGIKTVRCIFTDLDHDGWPDVILDREHVFLNRPAKGGGRCFVDSTDASGLRRLCAKPDGTFVRPNVLIAGDVDNDGDPDLFAGFYLELEKPRKVKGSQRPATEGDALVLEKTDHGLRSRILINDGKGCFGLREEAGLETPPETTSCALFVDYDNDGRLDLFTGNWYRFYGWTYEAYPDRLWQGRGDGTFREVTHRAGLLTTGYPGYRNSAKPTYGLAHCDWNNDGRQDLLVAVYGRQWNLLWKNRGNGTFVDVAAATGFDGDDRRDGTYPSMIRRKKEDPFRSNGNTFDAAPCDFDNDGDVDVFLAEITHWWAGEASDLSSLLVNQGREKGFAFLRHTDLIKRKGKRPMRWNQGDLNVGWIDFNNDGLPDLLLASSDYPDEQLLRLFRQKPDHTFEDRTEGAGFAWRNPTGISFADYDRDGDMDILVGNTNMRLTKEQREGRVLEAALFENRVGQRKNFLSLRLQGKPHKASRSAVGARVWVSAGGLVQMRDVHGGGGHAGRQNDIVLHFGLGDAAKVDWIRVRWPDSESTVQEFGAAQVNCFMIIRQGAPSEVIRDLGPRTNKKKPAGDEGEDFKRG
jgi:hypothetical protein